jgi:hypothetical protein
MTAQAQKKFLVLYLAPASVLETWSKTDPEARRAAEEKMRGEWVDWMGDHAPMIRSSEAAGHTKRVSSEGIVDAKNDIMLCAVVEADSHEAAAKAFQNHPHLQIPQSSIEVTEVRPM